MTIRLSRSRDGAAAGSSHRGELQQAPLTLGDHGTVRAPNAQHGNVPVKRRALVEALSQSRARCPVPRRPPDAARHSRSAHPGTLRPAAGPARHPRVRPGHRSRIGGSGDASGLPVASEPRARRRHHRPYRQAAATRFALATGGHERLLPALVRPRSVETEPELRPAVFEFGLAQWRQWQFQAVSQAASRLQRPAST